MDLRQIYRTILKFYKFIFILIMSFALNLSAASPITGEIEPVKACVIARDLKLTPDLRRQIAQCLGWQEDFGFPLCHGIYKDLAIMPDFQSEEIHLNADQVSFYREGQSRLSGNVEVEQTGRIVSAQTAYVYRDAKTNQISKIELIGGVRYLEQDRVLIARRALLYPQDKSGQVFDAIYRFNSPPRAGSILPAWGRASLIERFANQNYLLQKATYTNCAPQDKAWQIEADSILIDNAKSQGVARNAKLRIANIPVLYTPYLSFPTSKERKSGFLMPIVGHSSAGGFDFATPYYLNLAPNYDATITPHLYSHRGVMLGGEFRYLTPHSLGVVGGSILPHDKAFKEFINENALQYPQLRDLSTNRWSAKFHDLTSLTPDLKLGVNFQQVSDDYFLQDFSTNLAILTERQLLREGNITYARDNWLFRGLVQSYQTLKPINQTPISSIYERLPQLTAQGFYDDLLFNGNFMLMGQYDNFHWPDPALIMPEGGRFYLNPVLSFPQMKSWGYLTPSVELLQSNYNLRRNAAIRSNEFNRTLSRYYIDGGLYFDRETSFFGEPLTQTLEPRLFYLNVPYRNQTMIPVFDSAFMIFNVDQLFRTNRFSGFDRLGDANQLSYAVTTRWLSEETGGERASFAIGQIRYFADRRVQLCQSPLGFCIENPLSLGFLSPTEKYSPVAARGVYHFNSTWSLTGDYVWDEALYGTDNFNFNLHYQPDVNRIISASYTYLANGDVIQVATSPLQINALHQLTVGYAWPLNPNWSTLGAFSYNISKHYEMMSFLGVQYDSCCWAVRLVGGRSFQHLNTALNPQYNNNIYLQILLKGLGSAGNSDPATIIHTYIPGYVDNFHH